MKLGSTGASCRAKASRRFRASSTFGSAGVIRRMRAPSVRRRVQTIQDHVKLIQVFVSKPPPPLQIPVINHHATAHLLQNHVTNPAIWCRFARCGCLIGSGSSGEFGERQLPGLLRCRGGESIGKPGVDHRNSRTALRWHRIRWPDHFWFFMQAVHASPVPWEAVKLLTTDSRSL